MYNQEHSYCFCNYRTYLSLFLLFHTSEVLNNSRVKMLSIQFLWFTDDDSKRLNGLNIFISFFSYNQGQNPVFFLLCCSSGILYLHLRDWTTNFMSENYSGQVSTLAHSFLNSWILSKIFAYRYCPKIWMSRELTI